MVHRIAVQFHRGARWRSMIGLSQRAGRRRMLETLTPVIYVIGAIALLFAHVEQLGVDQPSTLMRAPAMVGPFIAACGRLFFCVMALLGGVLGIGGHRLPPADHRSAGGESGAHARSARRISLCAWISPTARTKPRELHGDEWQLDARVIKWTPRAVTLGAEPLYRLDRISGRYKDAAQAKATFPSVVEIGKESVVDLWQLKQHFPQWLPWIDADYGSAAYLPLADGANYRALPSESARRGWSRGPRTPSRWKLNAGRVVSARAGWGRSYFFETAAAGFVSS